MKDTKTTVSNRFLERVIEFVLLVIEHHKPGSKLELLGCMLLKDTRELLEKAKQETDPTECP